MRTFNLSENRQEAEKLVLRIIAWWIEKERRIYSTSPLHTLPEGFFEIFQEVKNLLESEDRTNIYGICRRIPIPAKYTDPSYQAFHCLYDLVTYQTQEAINRFCRFLAIRQQIQSGTQFAHPGIANRHLQLDFEIIVQDIEYEIVLIKGEASKK